MERLTEYIYEQVNLKGLDIAGIGEKNADILETGIRNLAEYEDTELTPKEVKYLRDAHSNVLKFVMDKMKIKNECDYWKKKP